MVTELTCNCTGGPEVVTSKGFDDAKLGVPAEQWPTFLELANEAATMWPSQLLRTSLLNALAEQKAELCIGVIGEDDSAEAQAMRRIQSAGFGQFEATAALDKCEGDASKALDLLATGWSPGRPGSVTQVGVVNTSPSSGYTGGCPFSGVVPSPHRQRCPFSGAPVEKAAAFGAATAPTPAPPQLDEKTADAVRTLAERGIPASQIASLLQVDEAAADAVLHAVAGPNVGRVLGSNAQQKLDELLTEDADLCCPVSLMLLSNPVVASDGFLYEKASLEQILQGNGISPMTRERLQGDFIPAVQRKKKAIEFREMRSNELLSFADEAIAAGQQAMAVEAAERVVDYINGLPPGSSTSIETKVKQAYLKLGRPAPVFLRQTSL
jgi:hypothetical protein